MDSRCLPRTDRCRHRCRHRHRHHRCRRARRFCSDLQSRENSNASRYDDFTVPALVRSPVTGELLAIVEGQAYGCHPSAHGGHGDEGDTDLIQRRSTDSVYKLVNRAS